MLRGHAVVDTLNAYLVWEPRRITPVFAVPEDELRAELAPPALPAAAVEEHASSEPPGRAAGHSTRATSFRKHTAPGEELDVVTPCEPPPRAAFRPDGPGPRRLCGAGFRRFRLARGRRGDHRPPTGSVPPCGHPGVLRSPLKSRSTASRWPARTARSCSTKPCSRSATTFRRRMCGWTSCKRAPSGPFARIRARRATGATRPPSRAGTSRGAMTGGFRDAAQIHGLVSFFNERVDITVDGVRQERPVTPWSRPDGAGGTGAPGCEPQRFGSLSPALGDDCPHWKR